jgi:hypothetical protein
MVAYLTIWELVSQKAGCSTKILGYLHRSGRYLKYSRIPNPDYFRLGSGLIEGYYSSPE